MSSVGLASAPENTKNKARRAEPAGFVTAAEGSGAASAFVRAFSGEVDTGSPSENATTQGEKSEARFYQKRDSLEFQFCPNGICFQRAYRGHP
jgi:hypothetical protein